MKMQRPDCHRAHIPAYDMQGQEGHRDENESVQDQFGGCGKIFSVNEKQPCKTRVNLCLKNSVFSVPSVAKGFTLIEMVVAIGILAMVIFIAGGIFKAGIESYRVASAQAEIMQKLRVITQQLDSDFRGLRKDAPMFLWFQLDPNDVNNRLDQIMFFADGDFQSTRLYDGSPKIPSLTGSPIISNVARIQYGQARVYSPTAGWLDPSEQRFENAFDRYLNIDHRTLARRQHLFVANPLPPEPPRIRIFPEVDVGGLLIIAPSLNDTFEHDTNSLSEWQAAMQNSANCDKVITVCFDDVNRPQINLTDANTLHLLMTQGVGSFAVQWSYLSPSNQYFWWPSIDPNSDGAFNDSDFASMLATHSVSAFGFYFNAATPLPPTDSYWFPYEAAVYLPGAVAEPVFPKALKFTFTLYDSRGIFRDGQTFTHIVYLGE